MSPRQRDEPSASSPNSASSAASTEGSPDATNTTPTAKITTKTEAMAATATGSTGISSAISAGIGAGTGIAVAGLILLLATAAVFFRRRKRRRLGPAPPTPIAETSSIVSLESLPDPAPPTPIAPLPGPQLTPATGLAAIPYDCKLSSGRNHSDIEKDFYHLDVQIQEHVQDNYHLDPVLVRPETLHASLCQLQLTEGTCRTVVRLSIDPSTRHVAIRHLLALVIFSNLDTHSVGSLSLLPPVLKELFKSRPEAYKEGQDSLVETALVGWNRLTAFLMHKDPKDKRLVSLLPSVESQIKTLAALLQELLAHFAHTDDDGSHGVQQAHLEYFIGECVKFGYMIFSDLCDWKFTFPPQERGVVVLPGLESHCGQGVGELYDSPELLLAPEVATVDLIND